ncbi:hypothetical protein GF108_20615 [Phyllobacterium sp. SYP-B3895]|uniref:SWIM zinc finger family protein n=1 Tax=Phyllobacterium sp. SYP-B3895 TaxID=2663240 RepID=UPI0012996CC1|nr:SWIM zinc finger family protein [Phyllobacterium sp. SYP-B3895]MRG57973.1 hypothetical protein [Phyllobacterium sp. SYP-B3895]
MSLTLARLEALAPDQASLAAAKKLLNRSNWPTLAQDGFGLVWGECQGSGSTPYRTVVSEIDAGYKCSCPIRKFPCKHGLALMWLRAEGEAEFATAAAPEWVAEWVSRRRGPSAGPATNAADKPRVSIEAVEDAEAPADPKADARAAAARERSRIEREASIANGLDELDIWLGDQLDGGLAAFPAKASAACRVMAQRLFDAKAPGLALRVDTLPTRLFVLPAPARPTAAITELAMLHLLAAAYRRQVHLADPLRQDVRQMVGWNITRAALLDDEAALRISDTWRVWATRSETQPDTLRRIETWLLGSDRPAVLIEYVPVAAGVSAGVYGIGDTFDAELVFYPSSVPLRAQIAVQTGSTLPSDAPLNLPAEDLASAYGRYEDALIAKPWLGEFPVMFRAARLRTSGENIYLDDETICLPVAKSQADAVWPLLQLENIDGAGLWDGYEFTLFWAETILGRWTA